MGLRRGCAERFLDATIGSSPELEALVARSFLSDSAKQTYLEQVAEGRKMLSVRD